MTQGDLSVEDYGKKMKKVVDALYDVGMPVDAPTVLLNLLRGVNSRFSTAADIITGTASMTFLTALDQLKLKELHLENEAKVEATNALVALSTSSGSTSSGSTSSGCTCSACRSTTSQKPPQQSLQQQPQQGNSGGQQRRRKNSGRRNGGGQQFCAPNSSGLWICINLQALQGALGGGNGGQWRGGQGVHGPPLQTNTAFGSSSTSWDAAGLTAAIQETVMQGNAWVMDTAASTHMHS
jgi:hypothetical protein